MKVLLVILGLVLAGTIHPVLVLPYLLVIYILRPLPRPAESLESNAAAEKVPNDMVLYLQKGVGGFVSVQGESNYQSTLSAAQKEFGTKQLVFHLKPEEGNKFDKNAMSVYFRESKVGYLSKADAKAFHQTYGSFIANRKNFACWGKVIGGSKGKSFMGVVLDFNLNNEKVYRNPPKEMP